MMAVLAFRLKETDRWRRKQNDHFVESIQQIAEKEFGIWFFSMDHSRCF